MLADPGLYYAALSGLVWKRGGLVEEKGIPERTRGVLASQTDDYLLYLSRNHAIEAAVCCGFKLTFG